MRVLLVFFAFCFLLAPVRTSGQVVIGEVMANPRGRESGSGSPGDRNEYVELYNRDSVAVDVEGWVLSDGDAFDVIEAWSDINIEDPDVIIETTIIASRCYAVLLDPEYVDTGDSTYMQPYDFPPATVVLTVGNTTIGNGLSSDDPLSLGTSDTVLVDTYGTPHDTTDTIPFNAGDGISIERIDLFMPDSEDNWAACMDSMGTPGGENSVTGVLEGSPIRSARPRLHARPNPFCRETTIVVKLTAGPFGEASEVVCIYDIAGRRIRSFRESAIRGESDREETSSALEIVWDGLEEGGDVVPAGVYFCSLTLGRESRTLSLVKLR